MDKEGATKAAENKATACQHDPLAHIPVLKILAPQPETRCLRPPIKRQSVQQVYSNYFYYPTATMREMLLITFFKVKCLRKILIICCKTVCMAKNLNLAK